jgi:hypothetical protein
MYDRLLHLLSEVVTSKTLGQPKNTLPLVQKGKYKGMMYKSPQGNPNLPRERGRSKIQGPSAPEPVLQRGRDSKRKP